MTSHIFEAELWLPAKRDTVFSFFADARNLEAITPPWLKFRIITPEPIKMHTDARIDYQLRVHGVPVRWKTEISVWDPPLRFVDKQLRGPYWKWIHTHTFDEKDGGTLCRDHVEYAVLGGNFINWLLVRRDVETIFAYRREALFARFRERSLPDPSPLPEPSAPSSAGFAEPSINNQRV